MATRVSERCSAGFSEWERLLALLTRARCEKACGKLPTSRLPCGSYCSLSSPTSLAAFEILRATRGTHGDSAKRHLLEINTAINQLGRLISDDPGVAEVIWSSLRGMVLVEMIVNSHLEWQRERQLLVDMVTRYLQD